jgi:hypothetical protein
VKYVARKDGNAPPFDGDAPPFNLTPIFVGVGSVYNATSVVSQLKDVLNTIWGILPRAQRNRRHLLYGLDEVPVAAVHMDGGIFFACFSALEFTPVSTRNYHLGTS